MIAETYPLSVLPGLSRLFLDYCGGGAREFFALSPPSSSSLNVPKSSPVLAHREELVALLATQNPYATAPLEALRTGADTVVTGQQVGLLGGPLFTPFKVATAIAHARKVSAQGHKQVAVFWLASEDHDFAEVNHITFPGKRELRKLVYSTQPASELPVGGIAFDDSIRALVEQAAELIGFSAAQEALVAAYQPGRTFAEAFAQFYSAVFSAHGLLILDANNRTAHRLGSPVLAAALERADELHVALVERNHVLIAAGYHAQVAVAERSSLLFLIDSKSGARQALKRTAPSVNEPAGLWQAGRESYSTADLLGILASEPERISPSALLRPLFQDCLLPTSSYIGGPAEVAYFAQSAVLYEKILGRMTPIVPRFSATLIEPIVGKLLRQYELELSRIFEETADSLAQRLGARALPIAGKQRLASAGNALNEELTALLTWMHTVDDGLARSGETAASKMRYQMNRLRRIAANFQLQREGALSRHAQAISQSLYPQGHLQERVLGAAYYLGRYGFGLVDELIEQSTNTGHTLLWL